LIVNSLGWVLAGPDYSGEKILTALHDGGKRALGRKRHIVVDVLDLLLIVVVQSAGIQDREGAKHVLTRLISSFPGLKLFWVDGG
jgi:putative transposase